MAIEEEDKINSIKEKNNSSVQIDNAEKSDIILNAPSLANNVDKDSLPPKQKFNIKRILSIYKQLRKKYPDVIDTNNIKMLSVGINKDIAEDLSIPILEASEFCTWYCGKIYKQKMIEGADRYNLKNEVTGKINAQEALWAKEILEKKENPRNITDPIVSI